MKESLEEYGENFIKTEILIDDETLKSVNDHKFKCFLIDTPVCNKEIVRHDNWVFEAYDYDDESVEKAISQVVDPILIKYDLIPKKAKNNRKRFDYLCKICQMIQKSKYFIADLSKDNTNVGLELGLALGISKETILMTNRDPNKVSDLKRTELVIYDIDKLDKLKLDFTETLRDIIKR